MWLLITFLLSLTISGNVYSVAEPLDKELTEYLYPFPVKYHTFKVLENEYKMAYMALNPEKDSSFAVVLLHGKNFSGAYWEKTARDLLKMNYRVIIPDQIGFGKSSKPESFPYSFQYLATLTRELLQKEKVTEYILVGHSMGGMLGARMALMYPEEVKKLILVNPIGLEDWKLVVPYKTVEEIYKQELLSNEDSIRSYQRENYYAGKWKDEYEKGVEIQAGWTRHPDYPRIAWTSALTTDMIFNQPVIYELPRLRMPTLLVIGTRDRTAIGKSWAENKVKGELGRYDLLGRRAAKLIPGAELKELSDIGHLPQIEAYDQYWNTIKGFLLKK